MSLDRKNVQASVFDLLGQVSQEIDIPRARRMFVNRNLRMERVEWIGFDMDYTLAIYHQAEMERISIDMTLKKMVENKGYPEGVLDLAYDPSWAIRGLVIDRARGNVFKMDRYGHVGRVFHGTRALSKKQRVQLYRTSRIRLSASRYAWIDTLFALPEAVIYVYLVDYLSALSKVNYDKLWQDIRECIDEAHRDGTLKTVIRTDPGRFVRSDPDLAVTLHKFRSSGKKLFLLTNSFWPYTNSLMSFLLDGKMAAYPSWRNYFDVVSVGAQKPTFFTQKQPFLQVDPKTGKTQEAPGALEASKVYQGGNLSDFEKLTGAGGDRVLYIGDHIFGDMLRAKKSGVWRTAMVVQELEDEIGVSERYASRIKLLEELDRRRRNLDADIDFQQLLLKTLQRYHDEGNRNGVSVDQAKGQALEALDDLRAAQRLIVADCDRLKDKLDRSYNPHWGPLFKEGNENSRFGEQVEDYACVYTSRVSNFRAYSPLRYFRSRPDLLPHETE